MTHCKKCGNDLPPEDFYLFKGKPRPYCKSCWKRICVEWKHAHGVNRKMQDAKDIGLYLGCCIAEKLLYKAFKNVTYMGSHHRGFDFICNNGFKVDVKSSTLKHKAGNRVRWEFDIRRNHIAEYFFCIGFSEKTEPLKPLKTWLIPGHLVQDMPILAISETRSKWNEYEVSVEAIASRCGDLSPGVVA